MCSWGSRKISMILLIFIYLSSSVNAQGNPSHCVPNGNYTRNSTYSTNLNTLLNSLSSNMTDYGYYTTSTGQSPNTVNGLALCRADRTLDDCRACVDSAARELLQMCPNQRQAVIWYEYCTLRYSNDPIHRTRIPDQPLMIYIPEDDPDRDRIEAERETLLTNLTALAANGTSEVKAGAGTRNYLDTNAFVQCTPDFSPEDCRNCLTRTARSFSNYSISQWLRLLGPDCNIRYDIIRFYNETRLRELRLLLPSPPSSPPPPPSSPPPGSNDNNKNNTRQNNTTKVILIIVIPVGVILLFAACAVLFMRKRMNQRAYETADDINVAQSLQYDFNKIRAATGDFDDANKLGEGGFGAVYKGRLETGEEVAVKRLSKGSQQGNMEFKNEVSLVAQLQHKNLVRLLRFAMEGKERVLVYEFVQNGSLDQFIFDPIKRSLLDWDKRYKIIWGTVKGILYLHEDSRLKIIHRDLKASNVLLDGDMNPKIADFGMARLFEPDETQANTTKIVGTYGYMSPEYAIHGHFSTKSDVFSFGVLVLEILTGRRNASMQNGEHMEDLLIITWKSWRDGTAATMMDPVLRNEAGSIHVMVRCIHIGLLCVQENPTMRPTMGSVVLMLSRSTMTLPVPSEPAFYVDSHFGPVDLASQQYDSNVSSKSITGVPEGFSQNDVSITELFLR